MVEMKVKGWEGTTLGQFLPLGPAQGQRELEQAAGLLPSRAEHVVPDDPVQGE